MSGIERLAVMFMGSTNYSAPIPGGCSSDSLNRVEVAGLLVGLSGPEHDYVYALFGDQDSHNSLVEYITMRGMALAGRESWSGAGRDLLTRMADTAVGEYLNNNCRSCNGTGTKRHRYCCQCHGSGKSRLKDADVAGRIGVDKSRYSRLWKRRYDCLYVIIQDIDCNVSMAIRRSNNLDALWLA